jgi:hypothetical protein
MRYFLFSVKPFLLRASAYPKNFNHGGHGDTRRKYKISLFLHDKRIGIFLHKNTAISQKIKRKTNRKVEKVEKVGRKL